MAAYKIIGFIKFENKIGLYRADYEAWILDLPVYCMLSRLDIDQLTSRKDKRFIKKLLRPIRKDDVRELVEWFDENAVYSPADAHGRLAKMPYTQLDQEFEENLPVVLYDFDELTAFENPDLNPFAPYEDFLPEAWRNVVVEGFDALVPSALTYWSDFAARLDHRESADEEAAKSARA